MLSVPRCGWTRKLSAHVIHAGILCRVPHPTRFEMPLVGEFRQPLFSAWYAYLAHICSRTMHVGLPRRDVVERIGNGVIMRLVDDYFVVPVVGRRTECAPYPHTRWGISCKALKHATTNPSTQGADHYRLPLRKRTRGPKGPLVACENSSGLTDPGSSSLRAG